jgi:hypothetical protein
MSNEDCFDRFFFEFQFPGCACEWSVYRVYYFDVILY